MKRITWTSRVTKDDIRREDGGAALIVELVRQPEGFTFHRLDAVSYIEEAGDSHDELEQLIGKTVCVTLEIMED